MGLVAEVDDETAPTVLVVDNNPMATHRLSNLFKVRNFNVVLCEDGDKAVDEYIRLDPELVVLALDIPSLDGHLAALEMREHGGECRILMVAPRRMAGLARDAAHSAGAVAWLEKPITAETLDAVWSRVLGPIPDAPGLEDLDALYPDDRIKPEADEGPMLPLPTFPLPVPLPAPLPTVAPTLEGAVTPQPVQRKRSRLPLLLIGLVAAAGGAAYAMGYVPV